MTIREQLDKLNAELHRAHLRINFIMEELGISDDEDEDDDDDDGVDDSDDEVEDDCSWIIMSGNRPENKGITGYWDGKKWPSDREKAKTFDSRDAAEIYIKRYRKKMMEHRGERGYFPPRAIQR